MVVRKEFLFSWDKVGKETEQNRLREFLEKELNIDWAGDANIEKIGDKKLKISKGDNTAEITLDNKAVLNYDSDRTYNLLVREEDGSINIYNEPEGIGKSLMGRTGILLIALYYISLFFILMTGIIIILPTVAMGPEVKTFYLFNYDLSLEARMVVIVALSGALGSLLHSIRSFYWYLGNRELVWSWVGMYFLMPFVGTALGVVFYIVIRGGFFSPQATVEQTSPFGFAALAALVGLFSEQAVLKLKKIAETVLTEAGKGKDAKPQDNQKNKVG